MTSKLFPPVCLANSKILRPDIFDDGTRKEFVDSNGGNDELSLQVNGYRNSEGFRTSSSFESH